MHFSPLPPLNLKPFFFCLFLALPLSSAMATPDWAHLRLDQEGERRLIFFQNETGKVIFRTCEDDIHFGKTIEEARENCQRKPGTIDIRVSPNLLPRELSSILCRKLGLDQPELHRQIRSILSGETTELDLELQKIAKLEARLEGILESEKEYGPGSIDSATKKQVGIEIKNTKKFLSDLQPEIHHLLEIQNRIKTPTLSVLIDPQLPSNTPGKSVTFEDVFQYFTSETIAEFWGDQETQAVIAPLRFASVLQEKNFFYSSSSDSPIERHPITFLGGIGRCDQNETTQSLRSVSLSQPFDLGVTEVTRGQWDDILQQARNKGLWHDLPLFSDPAKRDHPANNRSWDQIQIFLSVLNRLAEPSLFEYRLPSEYEWEFAARAISRRPVSLQRFEEQAVYVSNSQGQVAPVQSKHPNFLGLYDMLGNVAEFTESYRDYAIRMVRGGSYQDARFRAQPHCREMQHRILQKPTTGFRLARQERSPFSNSFDQNLTGKN